MTQPKVLRWSVIVGIIIVLNLFFNYTLSLVYSSPEWDAFCPQEQVVEIPNEKDSCVARGGQWTDNQYYKPAPADRSEEMRGYCDLQFTCRQEYEDKRGDYERNVFVVLVALGALSVLSGNFFKSNYVISSSLALGGVLSFVIASMRYWSSAGELIRVIILAIALGILFWVAWKKFNDRIQS